MVGDAAAALCRLAELLPYDWPTDLTPLRRLVAARDLATERDALRQRAEAPEAEQVATRAEAESLRRERDALHGEINPTLVSNSCRITAPPRRIGRLLTR